MSYIDSLAVSLAQGQDAERLRAVVDRTATEVKNFTAHYEEQRKIAEALVAAKSAQK